MNQNMSKSQVLEQLAKLTKEGHAYPWKEFEVWEPSFSKWLSRSSLSSLGHALDSNQPIRLKPRTVRVTTHSGETLELPEPWWDVPNEAQYYFVGHDDIVEGKEFMNGPLSIRHARCGNAFRTKSDAQAWADAMPRIRGKK